MLASMTGFGRAGLDAPFGKLVAEIQSVNRKYLEIFVSLPKEFSRFEQDVRTWVGEAVSRGQVSVRIHVIPSPGAALELLPDLEALKELKRGWEKIAKGLKCDPSCVDLPFLLLNSPLQQKQRLAEDKDLGSFETCVKKALSALVSMKQKEGKALCLDIKERLLGLKKRWEAIRALAPNAVEKAKRSLSEKAKELLQSPELDERIAREILLYADRVDISEEITRLSSHFVQFREILDSKEKSVGRKMDFLIQEMGREVNTTGSKSPDPEISRLVVEMKSELEKIREQAQNIE